MSQSYLGEVRIFAGTFAPRHWAFCDGQLLAVSSYDALFSLLGTTYGGDGRTTFGLPEMRGRTPIGEGSGPALTPRPLGQRAGQPQVTLTAAQMPVHNHSLMVSGTTATSRDISASNVIGRQKIFADKPGSALQDHLGDDAIGPTGANQPHNNYMRSLVLNFVVCIQGLFPPRN